MYSTDVYSMLMKIYKDHDNKESMLRIVKNCIELHLENSTEIDFNSLLKRIKEVLDKQ